MTDTLTHQEIHDNPMLGSTHVENSGSMTGFTPAQIADSDLPMVMKLLTSAYTRPHEAVIRELVANALDSHRDAGVSDPVTLILPTIDKPQLIVADHGLGLSRDDFTRVFGNVGASTKRRSLTSTGHMGIGSKSPYAIADQYQVKAVRDGSMIHALFAKTDEGVPSSKVLFEGPTEEPNGVTITVPVNLRDLRELQAGALSTLYWRERGEVDVRNLDAELVHWNDEGQIAEDFSTDRVRISTEEHQLPDVRVRMGGIGYEVPRTAISNTPIPAGSPLVFSFDPKEAVVSPSRESLEDTASLREKLTTYYETWAKHVKRVLREQLKTATSSIDFARKWKETPVMVTQVAQIADGYAFGRTIGFPMKTDEILVWNPQHSSSFYRRGRRNDPMQTSITIPDLMSPYTPWPRNFIVIDAFTRGNAFTGGPYEAEEFTAARRASNAYQRHGANETGSYDTKYQYAIITRDGQRELERLDADGAFFTFTTTEEVKALIPKKPRTPRRKSNEPIVFTQMDSYHRDRHVTVKDIDRSLPVVVVTKKDFADDQNQICDEHTFPFRSATVLLRENRSDKTIATELGISEDQVFDAEGFVKHLHDEFVNTMNAAQRQDFVDHCEIAQSINVHVAMLLRNEYWLTPNGKRVLSAANRRDIERLLRLTQVNVSTPFQGNQAVDRMLLDHPRLPSAKIVKKYPLTLNLLRFLSHVATNHVDREKLDPQVLDSVLDADRTQRSAKKKGGPATSN